MSDREIYMKVVLDRDIQKGLDEAVERAKKAVERAKKAVEELSISVSALHDAMWNLANSIRIEATSREDGSKEG